MRKLSTDRKISLAFLGAFALLAVVPMFVFENRGRLLADSRWVTHTQEVLGSLESTLLSLTEAESAIRGYVLTRQQEHLDRYADARDRIGSKLGELTVLTADNAAQQRRVEALKPLVRSRLARMDQVLADGGGTGQATGDVADDVRSIIADMRGEEHRLLERREATLETSVGNGLKVFFLVTSLNFLTLGFSFYLVNRYITHRRRTERTLSEAKLTAESANVAKSAFLANMSHEIRTPMSAIVGYADMLLDPGQTQSDRLDSLQTIRRNARHLLELINDILDLSKIEAGKMTVELIDGDVPQLVADIVSMMRPRAIEKGLSFQLAFDGPVPRSVKTDPLRLKQILVNLVGNAIKFTQSGGVELRVGCDVAGGRGAVRFDIVDTGIGIDPAQFERLFQPFNQADESTTRKFGGTGLGLTISGRLATMLGGTITASSTPGKGSTFRLSIDIGKMDASKFVDGLNESLITSTAPSEASPAQPETSKLAARILLVEDGPDNQRLISTYLRNAGADVTIADNGRVAVELATTRPFDLILMDMQMPELDGYAATTQLRRLGLTLPIVALTAHAMADDRAKCLDAGCTEYLTKPVEKQRLLATVRKLLPATSATLMSRYRDDESMREIIAEFVARLPEQVNELQRLLNDRDGAALKRLVHQIKGSGGGYGFQAITDAAARAERRCKPDCEAADCAAAITELIDVIRSVEGYESSAKSANANREAA